MNLGELVEKFGTDERCREYLEHLRWPDGVVCPKCGSKSISRISTRKQFDCNSCRKRFSVMAGTVFQDSKLPLWKWFAAVYLMIESKKGISANQLKRMLNVKSYETAWFLCHRIRSAMVEADPPQLSGTVEVDETYIGGRVRRKGRGPFAGSNKSIVVGAVERGGRIRLRAGLNLTKPDLKGFIKEVVADDAEAIYTDEFYGYGDLNDYNTRHEMVTHSKNEWVRGLVHTNTIESAWSLFDRGVLGSYHKLSKKHLPAYLSEFEFRFNNRENPHLFRDTILALVEADALTYKDLVHA